MTTVTINIEDGHEAELKEMLRAAPFKAEIIDNKAALVSEPQSVYERIKKIQEEIGDKELFKEIEDPSEWQRQIRKEWDRDF